jgi:hypothetical protein
MPRGVRRSISSTQAFWRRAANLSRVAVRRVSRSAAFAVGHDADALLERECEDVGRAVLLLEGSPHAAQAEGDQTFVGGVGEHDVSLGQWK